MPKYAILVNPGHNRVYFNAAKALAIAELTIALPSALSVRGEEIAGVYYATFDMDAPLNVAVVSRLSFTYALFEIRDGALYPIELQSAWFVDPKISSILKYTGKTNEIFTRMMINVAAMTYNRAATDMLKLLDPVAGKGTTLFEALTIGYDAYGIEIGEKAALECYHYIKRFLETEKVKHVQSVGKVNRAPRRAIDITRVKGEPSRHFEIVAANSLNVDKIYMKEFFDIIVGDLPYGVKHGAVTQEKQSSLTRNPNELLTICLPAWRTALKSGGVIALAYNENVLKRGAMLTLLTEAGFTPFDDGVYRSFSHAVDASIKRDVAVAKKRY